MKFSKITYFFLWLCHKTCGTLVPQRGIGPGPRQWKHWLPTTRLPGNAHIFNFFELKFLHLQNSINLYYREFLEIIIGNACHTPPFPLTLFFWSVYAWRLQDLRGDGTQIALSLCYIAYLDSWKISRSEMWEVTKERTHEKLMERASQEGKSRVSVELEMRIMLMSRPFDTSLSEITF